jgi:Uncharacterized protein conserved in bacteria (DUF2252)
MARNALGFARRLVLAIGLVLIGAPSARSPIRPDPEAIALAPPELIDRLRANPIDYFRFVNRPWIARVCELFADDVRDVPAVRLHGDAHVEQFAVTNDAWGLDDFDDSARGPAVVDIVRFLGSIDLATRQRGWVSSRQAIFDRFFDGYRKGLAEPNTMPPEPEIVRRLRAQAPLQSHADFLAWGETRMEPMAEASIKAVVAGMEAVSRAVYAEQPQMPAGYLTISRAGWLRMGVGSAVGGKILIRVQGPSADPDDDELIEAKELRYLQGLRCLEAPPAPPTLRVILGARQLGRLRYSVLAPGPELVIPELVARGRQLRDWWIRSWDQSYCELTVADLQSPRDLAAIAYDAGVQLGAGSLKDEAGSQSAWIRTRELASLSRLEPRIRNETSRLVEELLTGWKELRTK